MASNDGSEDDTIQSTITADIGQWLTMPLLRDGGIEQEQEVMDDNVQATQESRDQDSAVSLTPGPTAEIDGLGFADLEHMDHSSTLPLAQDGTFLGALPIDHTSSNGVGEDTVVPSVLMIDRGAAFSLEDGAVVFSDDNEEVKDNEVRSDPARKIKKHRPMSKEEQEMSILQIKAMVRMHNANPSSRNFKNAPPSLKENNRCKSNSELSIAPHSKQLLDKSVGKSAENGKAARKRSKSQQDPQVAKTSEPKKRKKMKPSGRKDLTISFEVMTTMNLLQKLGKPFENELSQIIDYAGKVFDAQEHCGGLIGELLNMEREWKNDHANKLRQMIAFLERHGIIPMGGVEAMSTREA